MACAGGEYHTITLSDDGVVHGFGRNNYGQLGLYNKKVVLPTPIPNIPKIMEISCGRYFTVCIDNDGGLWSFGDNKYGQLGTGNKTKSSNIPQNINDIPPVLSISCGYFHTLVLTNDSNLWSCGRNDYGQLCLGNTEHQAKYKQTSFEQVSKICAGGHHSIFQNNDGKIFGCGFNYDGQIGLGYFSYYQLNVTLIPNLPLNIVQFCSGFIHSLFLDSEGNVFSVGNNEFGNLGLGHNNKQNVLNQIPNIPPIRTISCVGDSSYLIDFEGNLWSFGKDTFGQLGHGDETNRNIPTKITTLNNITQIVIRSYGYHFLAKDSQNKIFTMGYNGYGQLGTGYLTSLAIPEEINSQYFPIWGECQIISRAKSTRK